MLQARGLGENGSDQTALQVEGVAQSASRCGLLTLLSSWPWRTPLSLQYSCMAEGGGPALGTSLPPALLPQSPCVVEPC